MVGFKVQFWNQLQKRMNEPYIYFIQTRKKSVCSFFHFLDFVSRINNGHTHTLFRPKSKVVFVIKDKEKKK